MADHGLQRNGAPGASVRPPVIGGLRTTLGELVKDGAGFIQTGPFGSQLHARDYMEAGTPVVMPQQLGDDEIRAEGIARIGDEDRERLRRHVMREGDIVFSRRGDVTRRAYITERESGWLCGTGCLLLRLDHPRCDNRYLARFLGLHEARSHLTQRAIGATMPNLNQSILASLPVMLPSLARQERVVAIISRYDELIQNNRQRMRLLERSARLLYEEWFVRCRFPGRENGSIEAGRPKGWRKRRIGDLAPLHYGRALRKADRVAGEFPVYGSGGQIGSHESAFARGPTILIGRKGNVGSVYWCGSDCWPIDTVYYLRTEDCSAFLYHALQRVQFLNTDVAVPGLNRSLAQSTRLLVPDEETRARFDEIAAPMREQMNGLAKENRKLAHARDLLSPRLMSGEIAA